jgi:hypothetical protein
MSDGIHRFNDLIKQVPGLKYDCSVGNFETDRRALYDFAELIVAECIAICQDIDGEDNTDARSGRQDCAVEIREHFGVE